VRRARLNTAAGRRRSRFENGATGCRETGVFDAIQKSQLLLRKNVGFCCNNENCVVFEWARPPTKVQEGIRCAWMRY
jgi:hypothetical protein